MNIEWGLVNLDESESSREWIVNSDGNEEEEEKNSGGVRLDIGKMCLLLFNKLDLSKYLSIKL